jgi:hypothetical protein
MPTAIILSNRAKDARAAMAALIDSRALSHRENDPDYPREVAALAWRVADAMLVELQARSKRGGR